MGRRSGSCFASFAPEFATEPIPLGTPKRIEKQAGIKLKA
jgi:hypothetical protein